MEQLIKVTSKRTVRQAEEQLGSLPFTDAESCAAWLAADAKNSEWALGVLYARQTATEQADETTYVRNDIGFNSRDAEKLTSVAGQMLRKRDRKVPFGQRITPNQHTMVAGMMAKYHGQLLAEAINTLRERKARQQADKQAA